GVGGAGDVFRDPDDAHPALDRGGVVVAIPKGQGGGVLPGGPELGDELATGSRQGAAIPPYHLVMGGNGDLPPSTPGRGIEHLDLGPEARQGRRPCADRGP